MLLAMGEAILALVGTNLRVVRWEVMEIHTPTLSITNYSSFPHVNTSCGGASLSNSIIAYQLPGGCIFDLKCENLQHQSL
jgi:hypothetical protein